MYLDSSTHFLQVTDKTLGQLHVFGRFSSLTIGLLSRTAHRKADNIQFCKECQDAVLQFLLTPGLNTPALTSMKWSTPPV